MSLTVSPQLLQQAQRGDVADAAFIDCIRDSLPYAWKVVSGLIDDQRVSEAEFADNQTPPPAEDASRQLLPLMASDSKRTANERYFGGRLAFQYCHRAAAFLPGAEEAFVDFVSSRAQILY